METFKRKRVGQTAVSDNQSSSVTLNVLAKPEKYTVKFSLESLVSETLEFQRRSNQLTEIWRLEVMYPKAFKEGF